MNTKHFNKDEHEVLHRLKHYLPAQAPLKDFIHHNTLHAFQHLKFHTGIHHASEIFGYKVSLSLEEFRAHYHSGRINHEILKRVIANNKSVESQENWLDRLLHKAYPEATRPRLGALRAEWKKQYHLDLDAQVHPILFRILCSYLDQGISMWNFPVGHKGFLASIREMEKVSFSSFFKSQRAKELLLKGHIELDDLLEILVGDPSLNQQYIFDQQFAHQGWSGMVSAIEDQPRTLLDHKQINIHDLVLLELLLEIDALDYLLGDAWKPLALGINSKPIELFAPIKTSELHEVITLWQEAFEWSYYDEVLAGILVQTSKKIPSKGPKSFQAMFCIDDRECSLKRYLEKTDPYCETFSTPGFFGVEFYYQPEHGKFLTKLCPAPVDPQYLIKEVGSKTKRKKELHFNKQSHSLFRGWLITQTLGLWSAIRLFANVFKPTMSPATASSFKHMDKFAKLTVENKNPEHREKNLQVGFTIDEMATRVENLLKSIGLVGSFAPIVYVVGHGSSSINNPHYAAYDCGACSGRAGSVNARVFCSMANHLEVRKILATKGIFIPEETQFIGGIHDTTRDEIMFFDEDSLSPLNRDGHRENENTFSRALDANAKERSRRFASIDTKLAVSALHDKIKTRSVSLFEPRPELNHATNTLCIVGRRSLTQGLFLDRRAFMNSYDYQLDAEGKYLFNILKAAAPVCGGINLEYFFSRTDNQKLGAGSKLPHNVMGLFGVANGIDGDLRPGLPSQMIEVHDPLRLLIIVEHYPDVVLQTIQKSPETYEWFINEWVRLVVMDPDTYQFYYFEDGLFNLYQPLKVGVESVHDLDSILENNQDNLPIYSIH